MPVCRYHGSHKHNGAKSCEQHWNYQGKNETKQDRAERSRRLSELRKIEATIFQLGLAAPGSKRWSGRKPSGY
jgi:hypothetical protein